MFVSLPGGPVRFCKRFGSYYGMVESRYVSGSEPDLRGDPLHH